LQLLLLKNILRGAGLRPQTRGAQSPPLPQEQDKPMQNMARDHGGNIGAAMARFGGADWIDLSTGINRIAYPHGTPPASVWQRLPTQGDMQAALQAAQHHYAAQGPAMICAGAQSAIQNLHSLRPKGRAAVLSPSYNEHAACLQQAGWQVQPAPDLAAMQGADLAVVVNPNNPDGRIFAPQDLQNLRAQVGLLVVDESFGDIAPHLSMLPSAGQDNLLILRSFGKFWGLAGARFGLVFGAPQDIAVLRDMAGPWPVSGPALWAAQRAYGDIDWANATRARLARDAVRLDTLARSAGWDLVGGCDLFRLYNTPSAAAAQNHLAQSQIWSRIFPYSQTWLRLGPPGDQAEWDRLSKALNTQ
jgi:cobalamin biosynthetic protein CobC